MPTLIELALPNNYPAVRLQAQEGRDQVTLRGHHLSGSDAVVRFTHPRLPIRFKVGLAAVADSALTVGLLDAIPDLGGSAWVAGVYNVQLEVVPPGKSSPRASNSLPLILAPSFSKPGGADVTVIKGDDDRPAALEITLTTSPAWRESQSVSLLVGGEELPLKERTPPGSKLTFRGHLPHAMLQSGRQHLLRLRVDAIESVCFELDAGSTSEHPRYVYDPEQTVTIP